MNLCPVTQLDAQEFIYAHHRHHPDAPWGITFVIGVEDDGGELCGVIQVGRPAARHLADGVTLEVRRSCVKDAPHANSMLYAAAWRAAKALGYSRLITYTEAGETGASLRAAGWRVIAERPARGSWAQSSVKRKRRSEKGGVARTLWEAV